MTPRTGATAWSALTLGGAALNPAVSGTSRMSLGSNAGKLISLDLLDRRVELGARQHGERGARLRQRLPVRRRRGGDRRGPERLGVLGRIRPPVRSTGCGKLNADAIQGAVSTYLRPYFSSAMTTAYPGSYDIVFVATMNNTGTGGFTNNKVFALRSDTGATLWTFSPATLSRGLCPSGCGMDQVLGQPWVDYVRDRLYVASRDGSAGTQNSLWFLDIANSGNLVKVFSGADFTTGPSQSSDGNSLWIGDEAGDPAHREPDGADEDDELDRQRDRLQGIHLGGLQRRRAALLRDDRRQRVVSGDAGLGLDLLEDEAGGQPGRSPSSCRATPSCGWAAPTASSTS